MIQLHLRLPEEKVELIENVMEGDSRTEKVQNFFSSNIIGRDMLLFEKDKCESKLRLIERSLAENPFYNIDSLSELERDFLEETFETLSRKSKEFSGNPSFMTARKNLYNEKFSKSITTKEFELLLYKFKDNVNI